MPLVFDTSVIISLEKQDRTIISRLQELSRKHQGIPQASFITYFEFQMGIKNRSPRNQSAAMEFLRNFRCLPATQKTSEILADLKYKYDRKGVALSLAELIIASQSKEANMTLVTKDKTFAAIEEIQRVILD